MLNMEFKRARSKEQKDQRMEEIMTATDALFHETSYHGITLTTIADKLGWSRGNLYKYVTTKEEIFLELYGEKQRAWISDAQKAFSGCDKLPLKDFTDLWSQILADHEDFLKYQNILAVIIETNVPVERLAEFKKQSRAERRALHMILMVQCPQLSEEEIRMFLLMQLYHGCGLYNHVHFSPNLIKALQLANIPIVIDDFKTEFQHFLLTYMTGMN